MVQMEQLLYLVTNLLHIYVIYIFFEMLLGENRFNNVIKLLSFSGYYILNSIGHIMFDNLIVNLATNIIPPLIISLEYNKSWGQRIFCVSVSSALEMFTDLAMYSIFSEDNIMVNNGCYTQITMLAAVYLIKHFIGKKNIELKSGRIWFIMIISIGTIVIGQLTIEQDYNAKSLTIAIILLLTNFANFYMYDREFKQIQIKHNMKLIESSNQAYQNQLKIMSETQDKIRFLRHDMKNHIYKMKKLIENSDYSQAIDYIDEMEQSITVNDEYVKSGNNDIDCLLNYKLSIAKKIGTEFKCSVMLPDKLVVTPFDLTTILGNLLDNAINALEKTEDKKLNISIIYSKGTIKIDIENTYNIDYEQNKNSNRQDHCEHGIGLMSVEQALNKYHGVLKTHKNNGKYYTNIFLYNSFN